MTSFARLHVSGWRQFAEIDLQIHPNLTIITGANGAGKSTLLSLFSRHFGFNRSFLSTPVIGRRGSIAYSLGLFRWLKARRERVDPGTRLIGQLEYDNGTRSKLYIKNDQSLSYDLRVHDQQTILGIHIDSHRPPNTYRHISQIPVNPINFEQTSSTYSDELRHHYNSGGVHQGTLYHLKTSILNMAIFGYGNKVMPANHSLVNVLEGFQEKLREVLPAEIGFLGLSIRSPEIVIETRSGDFVIDAASGGVIKLIEITWQLYLFSLTNESFSATIDEPENHLHPSMQRNFLATLVKSFPRVQFIVVSHSPFVVSSVKDSNVFVLQHEAMDFLQEETFENRPGRQFLESAMRVVSVKLDTINKAGTAAQILRDALGVPTTLPDWAEDRLQQIVNEYRHFAVSEDILKRMYDQLESEGLIAEYPDAVKQVIRER